MGEPLLITKNLVKDFGTKVRVRVLHGIDLTVEAGEFAAIIGPSGSGKSTLLNLIGLLDRPTSGQIVLANQDIAVLGDRQLATFRGQHIGFVFQFHHLLTAFTAAENVFLPLAAAERRLTPAMRERALSLLTDVGLEAFINKRVADLSGGQQQRVAIARALVRQPALILADEPTGNLDTQTADAVFALFRKLNRERGTAIIVVTHDERLARRCDRIIDIVDGRVASDVANVPQDKVRQHKGHDPEPVVSS